MFLPTTKEEMKKLGWDYLDVILVTGDAYIDSPLVGVSLIGKVLLANGYKTGIIAQPDIYSPVDITRLGEPLLFWGITSGCVDSMVSNYTPLLKKRKNDDYTPGELNNKRPDRAVIVYTNLVKKYFKNKNIPIIIGGLEASLRRIAHYDYWSDSIRRSILFDSKADILVYGMGEKTILELAECIKEKKDYHNLRGICYISNSIPQDFVELPSYEEVINSKLKFIEMFHKFYLYNTKELNKGLFQKYGNRYLIHNPPQLPYEKDFLDYIYNLEFERDAHPYYLTQGKIKALETIKFSITSHRGCIGSCSFCSIPIHQGIIIQSRSKQSIIKEIHEIINHHDFKGYISDIGGPTANMYNLECKFIKEKGICINKNNNKTCLFPDICPGLKIEHKSYIELLKSSRKISGIKKIFIGSGLRYDLILKDSIYGIEFLQEIIKNHVSGQLKVAPEHISDKVLELMRKCKSNYLLQFIELFNKIKKENKKNIYLTYYFLVAHPGCEIKHMKELSEYIKKNIKIIPEQVQIFTPTPSTYSTLMYSTSLNPWTLGKIFVEKSLKGKKLQKDILQEVKNENNN